jgi:hypothetical protein
MKKVLLLLVIIFAVAYVAHRYGEKSAPPPEVVPATPEVRRATPTPTRRATSLETHSLNSPDGKANPLNAPHR